MTVQTGADIYEGIVKAKQELLEVDSALEEVRKVLGTNTKAYVKLLKVRARAKERHRTLLEHRYQG